MNEDFEAVFREHWWAAVATVSRLIGDLEIAEDAVQDACAVALRDWPEKGLPANPRAWLIGTARHKALDRIRRESRRTELEAASMSELSRPVSGVEGPTRDDELSLIFMCCHPALDISVRVPLTLRSVCGLSTAAIATVFLVAEPTMAQRLVRAKRKIRDARIPFRVPPKHALPGRLHDVLRVVYLVYTEGHRTSEGPVLVRADLCEEAIRLARVLHELLPEEPEVTGLLALLLLTDARRPGRVDDQGHVVLLADQDRSRWNREQIEEGSALVAAALAQRAPGTYQLQAAIAALHSTAPSAQETDWREIAAVYGELIRHEPSPVVEANRAVAVAMAEGPAAGLVILDALRANPQMDRWPQLHIARADLLERLRRPRDAAEAYRLALQLEPPKVEREFIARRLRGVVP
ncbi:MAG: RNA polymerase sigma factor [Candidatus Dormibacteraeota bacterium]|nr:RNA polymerase sigma factor [Candidatus Dormibacteraeota bacterium]